MTKAELLLDLQDVDSVIDRLTRRLSEIKAALHETAELIAARSALRTADESVTYKRAHRKELDLADATLETRIKQADERLYSGTVRNPKELLDLQNDIASLKRQKNTLDDQLFAAMVALEEAETELKSCSDTLTSIDAEWRASQGDLATELTQLERDLAEKAVEQTEARAQLNAPDLAQYDQLRRRKGGVVVVEMEGSVCGACGVRVSAHIAQQVSQVDHLARCGNCERILVRV
jgi:predicted  nucleic acid-binding Zn-ribbon protein